MAEYYLAASGGSNGNPGTEALPWATMAFALTQLAAGDTLYCRAGTHGEINITASVNAGTSWSNAITVTSYEGETATLPRIRLAHTSVQYWIFSNLLLDGTDTQANGFAVQTGVDFVRCFACELTNYTSSAILVDSTSLGNVEIIGNYIHDSNGNGILCRSANNLIQGNTIINVNDNGIAIALAASTTLSNNTVTKNYIYSIGTSASDIGILISNGSNNTVTYNVIAVGTGDGIELGVDGINTNVFNNTIYANVGNGIEILASNDGGNTIRNNIIYNNGATIVDGRGDATTSHNLTTDPSFVNAGAGNFELQATSAARNAGTDVGLITDFLGHAVPQGTGPDIGAFEFEEEVFALNTLAPGPPPPWHETYTPARAPDTIVLPLSALILDVGYGYVLTSWPETYILARMQETPDPPILFAFSALEHSAPHLARLWQMQQDWWPFVRHSGSAEVMPTITGMGIFLAIDAFGTLYLTDSQPAGSGTATLFTLRDSVTGVLGEIDGVISAESSQLTVTHLPNPPGLPGTPLVVLDPAYPPEYVMLHDTGGTPWYLWNLEGSFLVQDTPPDHYQDATPPGSPYTWWELPMLSGAFAAVSITPLGDITISDTPPAGEGLAATYVLGDAAGVLWHFGVTADYNLAMSTAVAVDFAQMPTCLVFSDQAHGRWFVRIADDQGIIISSVLEPHTMPWQAVGELGWIRIHDPLGGLDWYLSMDPSHSLIAQHAPPLGTPPGLDAAQALLRDSQGLWWKFVAALDGGIGLEPQPPEMIPLAPPLLAASDCLEALRHVEAAGAITTLWVV